MVRKVCFLFLSVFIFSSYLFAAEKASTSANQSWVKYYPYSPEKNEYQAELGSMWEKSSLYWIGLTYGHHLGQCYFSDSKVCAQYFDVTGGFGNRDAITHTAILGGLRWQFSNGIRSISPLARVFVGAMNVRDDERGRTMGTAGFGVGVAARLHPRLDFKCEARVGQSDFFWATTMVSFSMHLDSVVETTLETTSSILKTTISAPKTFVDWFNKNEKTNDGKGSVK